jgi:phage tail sheath protein FI
LFNASLGSGTDDFVVTNGELQTAYDKFKDGETVDINLLLTGPSDTTGDTTGVTKATAVIDVAEFRKDCVAFISPPKEASVDQQDPIVQTVKVKTFADALASTSYASIDSGHKYQYDKYNDVYRYVPLNGDIAGLCARTDNVADAWFSPGGLNRGQIRGAVKLAFSPNKSQRDELYRARVNPVVTFPGQGTVLFGDKTALAKPSAFDRINVRRLFIVLEKAISTASKFQLFEFNDEFTRAQFRNLVEPFLRDVQGRRGLTDFKVVCDDTNNTGDVIDRNEFRADIFIKPNRSINFITLNFIATRSGVSFSEVAGA